MPTPTPQPTPSPQGHYRFTFGSGARPLDGYTIKRAIGRGGFGEVYYATSDSGKEVALKLILRNLDVERRGVSQCMNLKCPHLLTIYDLKTNDAGDAFVVMEYVAGPSLANVLAEHPNGLPPAEVRAWLKGLVEGIAYLHDHGIVHRDLKPANLFMEEGIVKIGDYGLAKLINTAQESEHSNSIGTCHYMAPEIASGKYNKPIDIYATGVVLYEMLTGRVPFEGETAGEILMKHLTARPDLSPLPEPYRSIVGRALAKDPSQRPGRPYDLLPAEDAPKQPAIRFLDFKGARARAQAAPPTSPPTPPRDDDILRINAEEPPFYIGPETRPPVDPRARRAAAKPRPAPAPRYQPGPARVAAWTMKRAARVESIPTEPPPLPSGRVRIAELSGSMLWAALLAVLFAVGASFLMELDLTRRPEQFVYVYGLTLLGSWAVLGASKATEVRALDPSMRRLLSLALGLALGLAGEGLEQWIHVGFQARGAVTGPTGPEFAWLVDRLDGPLSGPVRVLAYFGLIALVHGGWRSLAARDRKARFRVLPVVGTALVSAALWPLSPYAEPYVIGIPVMIAAIVQLASPWNADAAAYARARSRLGRVA